MSLSKEEKFYRVSQCVLDILSRNGESGLSVSRLAKKAGVSRAWIYKNFGTDKEALLFFAAKSIGEKFAEIRESELPPVKSSGFHFFSKDAEKTLRDVEKDPWIPKIYFEYAGGKGPISLAIKEIEEGYVKQTSLLLMEILDIPSGKAQSTSLALLKMHLAIALSWVKDEEFRILGKARAVELMLSPLR